MAVGQQPRYRLSRPHRGQAPSHRFDGVDLNTVVPGSIARFYTDPKASGNQGGRGLAPDSGGSATQVSTEQAPSGASPLPQFYGVDLSTVAPARSPGFTPIQRPAVTRVGGGLPPMAVGQARRYRLSRPHRGQAPSHSFDGVPVTKICLGDLLFSTQLRTHLVAAVCPVQQPLRHRWRSFFQPQFPNKLTRRQGAFGRAE